MLPLQDQIGQMVLNVGLSALDCSEIFSVLWKRALGCAEATLSGPHTLAGCTTDGWRSWITPEENLDRIGSKTYPKQIACLDPE
ncbi:MAG: hypothetical protein QOE55_4665 [Acidobacteriaceae bacterium]|jgi:hypothetical protein|nr:hypothetical protein [Acidobacteriaceae bacterium]MEA3004997.1 hypothetical protein [Acidobacteriaceae bacterium]